VKVIGGGRISDVVMATPDVKAGIVTRLRGRYKVRDYAFGDSEVDFPMLKIADESIFLRADWKQEFK
jgi:phosphoserine phosphatase